MVNWLFGDRGDIRIPVSQGRVGRRLSPWAVLPLAGLLLSPPPSWASTQALLSRVDGQMGVVRNIESTSAVTGSRLLSGDILDLPAGKFAQIEAPESCFFALEGIARVMLQRLDPGRSGAARLVLLDGWLKVQPYSADSHPQFTIDTPKVRVTMQGGSALLHVEGDLFELFSEASTPHLTPLDGSGRSGPEVELGREQLAVRQGFQSIKVKLRPDPEFVKSVPMEMRDTLTPVVTKLHIEPPKRPLQPVSFGEIEAWLTGAPVVRHGLAGRFQSRIHDTRFRAEIEAHLAQLPEWHDILYPPPPPPPPQPPPPPRRPQAASPAPPAPAPEPPGYATAPRSNESQPR